MIIILPFFNIFCFVFFALQSIKGQRFISLQARSGSVFARFDMPACPAITLNHLNLSKL
jgi:hypothetical protein